MNTVPTKELETLFVTDEEMYRRLGINPQEGRRLIERFEAMRVGFPPKHPIVNKRYWPAVKAFFDKHFGGNLQGYPPAQRRVEPIREREIAHGRDYVFDTTIPICCSDSHWSGVMAKKSKIAEPHFHDEDAARAWFENARWPNGPVCPHCKSQKHYATKKVGRYRCANSTCRKDFTVMTGSVMERSHAPLTHWAYAFTVAVDGKKGFAAHQLMRQLKCQYNTAWFLHHRVMEAMRRGGLDAPPMGGNGKVVEADETYFGTIPEDRQPKYKTSGRPYSKDPRRPHGRKHTIIALVERDGDVRSFHVPEATLDHVVKIVRDNISRESRLHTDESKLYFTVGKEFAAHETVVHSAKEYARGDVTTNSVEGYFSIFKRGMKGVYQHCAEKNLHRYLAEFDFRYNTRKLTDGERAVLAVRNASGKRLTYRQPH